MFPMWHLATSGNIVEPREERHGPQTHWVQQQYGVGVDHIQRLQLSSGLNQLTEREPADEEPFDMGWIWLNDDCIACSEGWLSQPRRAFIAQGSGRWKIHHMAPPWRASPTRWAQTWVHEQNVLQFRCCPITRLSDAVRPCDVDTIQFLPFKSAALGWHFNK